MTIERIIKKFAENHPGADTKILERAFIFANEAHESQFRKNGDPYIQHPLHTAYLLTEIKADLPTVAAGILHDVPEDTKHTLGEIKKKLYLASKWPVSGLNVASIKRQ